jgi:adenosylcobinamide-GDP ribazoletransferase
MSLAPGVGLLLAILIGGPVAVLAWALDASDRPAVSFLIAVLAVIGLAWLTRGLHLDGLADLADALGSGKPADQALDIARRSDIGPFGTMSIVLALLLQVASLSLAIGTGHGAAVLATALISSRLGLTWACTPRWPAARPDGLGAMVATSTRSATALATTATWIVLAWGTGWLLTGSAAGALMLPSGVVAGVLATWAICTTARRRLGGITGDVLGACVESSLAASLVTMAVLASLH